MENKMNKRHYVLYHDIVELSTCGAYHAETDDQETRFFCVPCKWAEDWVAAYDGRKFHQFLDEYTWDDTKYMYADAKKLGQLLPSSEDAESGTIHYHMFSSSKELADEVNELPDASFYDVCMILAQSFGISYVDIDGFCEKLRSILFEIQTSLIDEYGSIEELVEAADRNS